MVNQCVNGQSFAICSNKVLSPNCPHAAHLTLVRTTTLVILLLKQTGVGTGVPNSFNRRRTIQSEEGRVSLVNPERLDGSLDGKVGGG